MEPDEQLPPPPAQRNTTAWEFRIEADGFVTKAQPANDSPSAATEKENIS